MAEDMSRFRRATPTSNESVQAYHFVEREIQVEGEWEDKMLQYAELHDKMLKDRKMKKRISAEDIEKRQILHKELDGYLQGKFASYRRSVLKRSLGQKRLPHQQGKDSHVFFFGELEDFLEHPSTPHYVSKYSVPDRPVSPDNIEYLANTYKLLQRLMGEHVPRAWFVLGEFRHSIPKHGLGNFSTSFRAITIQREIRGKTFAQMTPAEKHRPEVQEALRKALAAYDSMRNTIQLAARELGIDFKECRVSLDIGDASADERSISFDPLTYASPNVMYDEEKKTAYFIDMGWGAWTPYRKDVYDHVLKGLPKES